MSYSSSGGVERDTNNASNQPRMMTPHTAIDTRQQGDSREIANILISYLSLLSYVAAAAVVVVVVPEQQPALLSEPRWIGWAGSVFL